MRVAAARAVSIAGHPVVLMFVAGMVAASQRGIAFDHVRDTAVVLATLAGTVVFYTLIQVRAGRWAHVDASARHERASLNMFLAAALLAAATFAGAVMQAVHLCVALMLAAFPVLAALLLSRWVKASLHMAFAAFATILVWPSVQAVTIGLLVAVAVAWSRLVLGRHTMPDIVVGALLGFAAGGAYLAWDA